jgi:hypothetical protein
MARLIEDKSDNNVEHFVYGIDIDVRVDEFSDFKKEKAFNKRFSMHGIDSFPVAANFFCRFISYLVATANVRAYSFISGEIIGYGLKPPPIFSFGGLALLINSVNKNASDRLAPLTLLYLLYNASQRDSHYGLLFANHERGDDCDISVLGQVYFHPTLSDISVLLQLNKQGRYNVVLLGSTNLTDFSFSELCNIFVCQYQEAVKESYGGKT